MLYIEDTQSNLQAIFAIIEGNFSKKEEVPNYLEQVEGLSKYRSALEAIKSSFYQDFFDKCAFLLIHINKGHFFSNGNKRLSLVTTCIFIAINDFWFKECTKEKYLERMKDLFPDFKDFYSDDNFKPYEFALYNLSIIIADNHLYETNFDTLKAKIKSFLGESLIKVN